MTEEDSSNQRGGPFHQGRARIKKVSEWAATPTGRGVLGACIFAVLVGIAVWRLKPTAPAVKPDAPNTSDPTAVITTFITLYGLFIGGFGVLIGFVAKKSVKKREYLTTWKAAAITFLILGAFMDLWRVLDSTNDLFTAATSGLKYPNLKDDITDFEIYFSINVFVVAFSIWVAALPARADGDSGHMP